MWFHLSPAVLAIQETTFPQRSVIAMIYISIYPLSRTYIIHYSVLSFVKTMAGVRRPFLLPACPTFTVIVPVSLFQGNETMVCYRQCYIMQ